MMMEALTLGDVKLLDISEFRTKTNGEKKQLFIEPA